MSALEQLQAVIRMLDDEQQARVLAFARNLTKTGKSNQLSPSDLMHLPTQERERLIEAALEASADEDFEVFEAYSEETPLDD
ncbi:MAG: hypothetical protein IT320_02830 [Anaerolineae bacterium]|nr:hypothetical protein [Anaerolineae bacterium]